VPNATEPTIPASLPCWTSSRSSPTLAAQLPAEQAADLQIVAWSPTLPLVVVANLLRPLLVELASTMPCALAHLVDSGLLREEVDEIGRAFAERLGLRERRVGGRVADGRLIRSARQVRASDRSCGRDRGAALVRTAPGRRGPDSLR
jgi:hypothetical protein